MAEVVLLPDRVPSLDRAVEQFLAAKPLSANARRSYAYCLGAVVSDLGAGTALADVTPERLRGVLEQRWGNVVAATWNSRLAAVGSFRRWVQAQGWVTEDPLAGIERRPQVRDDTTPVRYQQLHALWTRADSHVREKTLWRMLYETAARANEILALNIEDLHLTRHPNHRIFADQTRQATQVNRAGLSGGENRLPTTGHHWRPTTRLAVSGRVC